MNAAKKKMPEFNFFITSADGNHRLCDKDFSEYNALGESKAVPEFICNNVIPLTKLYNTKLNEMRSGQCPDFAVFMHADVKIDVKKLIDRVLECKDKYDIMGFAGTKKLDISHSPLSWFTASNGFEDKRYGKVIHDNIAEDVNFFNHHDPDVKDTKVITVDGLCMVLGKNVLESDQKFDESFTFDFYDIDFCLDAVLNRHLNVGCIIETIRHASVGMSITKKKYLVPEKIFRDKWNFQIS